MKPTADGGDDMAASTGDSAQAVKRSLQFATETVVPGGSNLLNGDFKSAGIYLIAGVLAIAVFCWTCLIFVCVL